MRDRSEASGEGEILQAAVVDTLPCPAAEGALLAVPDDVTGDEVGAPAIGGR